MQNLSNLSPSELIATLIIGLIVTWGIGLAIPLVIRFIVVKNFLSKGRAIGVTIVCFLVNFFIFVKLLKQNNIQNALFLVAMVSYFILRKGHKKDLKSQAGS